MKQVVVRPASESEIQSLVSVVHAAVEQYRDTLDPPSGAHGETEETIGQKMLKGGAVVATYEDRIVGCAFWEAEESWLYVGRLAVLPEYRRTGVGSRLLQWIEDLAIRHGHGRVQLGVRLALPGLKDYYARKGYGVIRYGSHAGHSEPTYVRMEKSVRPPRPPGE